MIGGGVRVSSLGDLRASSPAASYLDQNPAWFRESGAAAGMIAAFWDQVLPTLIPSFLNRSSSSTYRVSRPAFKSARALRVVALGTRDLVFSAGTAFSTPDFLVLRRITLPVVETPALD